MNSASLFYWQEKLGKTQPRAVKFSYTVTGAGTASELIAGNPVLTQRGAIASQAIIDTFLGTTTEFNYLAFDATAMGTDAVCFIVNMLGQVDKALIMTYRRYDSAGALVTEIKLPVVAALTNSSLTTQFAKGANGNMAARVIDTGLDAATTGLYEVTLEWIAK